MSTTKTRQDLIFAAMFLIAPDAGQTPSAEDISAIDAYVNPMVATLAAKGIVFVDDIGELGPSGGNIDPALFLPLVRWLADAAGIEFGLPFNPDMQASAEHDLRVITAGRPTYQLMQAEYF